MWCKELTHWKRPWCWERLRAGEGDDRGWDGWMASPTWWTWVWVNSGSWWWTGKPGMLQSMGSQRVRPDWVTELNWTELSLTLLSLLVKSLDWPSLDCLKPSPLNTVYISPSFLSVSSSSKEEWGGWVLSFITSLLFPKVFKDGEINHWATQHMKNLFLFLSILMSLNEKDGHFNHRKFHIGCYWP